MDLIWVNAAAGHCRQRETASTQESAVP